MEENEQIGDQQDETINNRFYVPPGAQQEQRLNPHRIAEHYYHKKQTRFRDIPLKDRLLVEVTIGALFLAGVTAWILQKQAGIMGGTLEEIRGTSRQTERLLRLQRAEVIDTGIQAKAAKDSVKAAQRAFEATQRPIISIGRKDGTLAEFVVPAPDVPDQNVGIKIYLQNGGQSAALTPNLGLLPFNAVFNGIGMGQSTPPTVPLKKNTFQHLMRAGSKNGSHSESGAPASIAPQSEYVYYFSDQVSREQYESMIQGRRALILTGICEYCDALGQYTCRQFTLFWQGPPFNAFSEVSNTDCALFYGAFSHRPNVTPGQRLLHPCEQPNEREAREKQERTALLKRAASPASRPKRTKKPN